ncbi:restriction endonuclease subunit S [Streptococcus thermophilus]|nr:restriction endonuclease subunit S [Streptococcus thermophilus]MCT2946306.1 restriction endonuclease subunit S [Streptococcus thermophilus]
MPKFRFNKFLESWKRLKYEDVIEVNSGKDYKHLEKGDIPVYGTGGYMLSVSEAITNKDGVGIGRKGTINKPYILKAPYWTVDTLFFCIPKNKYNLYFINAIFERTQWERFDESTGVPSLSKLTINNIQNYFPSFDEQSVIGSLFRTLDDLLSSYKNNLANYQSLKAIMLSKMFPKAGHTVPEIRLDGFEGDWELLEINDLADDFQSGGTPKTNVQEYWNGNIPWIQSSDLETNCLFETKVQKSISEKGLKNSSAKIIPKDSIAVVTRVGVGKLAVMRHEYATSQDFLSFSNLKSNIEFTAYLLYRLLQKEVTQLQGTSIKGITKVELLSKKVLIPSLPEQQAIGAYFSNLDNLINSYQEKISQLETLKKKLLQDMFI